MQQSPQRETILALGGSYRIPLLATVSMTVLTLAASPTQAGIDPMADDPFGDLSAISDVELSDLRGGFIIPTPVGLLDIGIGISDTVVTSVAGLDNLGGQIADPLQGLGPQITQAVNEAVLEAGGHTPPSNNAANAAPAARQNASSNSAVSNSAVANANAAVGSAVQNAVDGSNSNPGTPNTSSSASTTTTSQGSGTAASVATSQSAVTSLTALDTPAQGAVSAAPEPPADSTTVLDASGADLANNTDAVQTAIADQGTTRITTTGAAGTARIIENTRDNVMITQVVSLNLRFQEFNRMSSMNATRGLVSAVQAGTILYSLR